jgi:beta-hydroxylase
MSTNIADAAQTAPAPPPPPSSKLVPKKPLIMKIGKYLQPRINRIVARSSRVGNEPFHDTVKFPWIAELEANWKDIEAEALEVVKDVRAIPPLAAISPDHRRIAPAEQWRSFFLYGYEYRVDANCVKCPRTTALIEKVPGLNSALFSVLVPGTHIPAHTGVTKAILTCHLGIKVPPEAEKCQIRVVDQKVGWEPGRAFVFDDVYQHEVLNDTDEVRVILLVQFRRPVGLLGKIFGGAFLWSVKHSRFVQDARRGVAEWKADNQTAPDLA